MKYEDIKRIKTPRKSLGVVIIASTIAAFLLVGCSSTIDLPNAEVVTKVKMGTLSITNADDIYSIISALSASNRINRNAMNEQPFGQNLLRIYLYMIVDGEKVMSRRLYLYTNGGTESLWNSYVGIYRISQENSDILRQLYANMLITNDGMGLEDESPTGISVLTDAEIEAKYQIALETISWFHLTTMPVESETFIEADGRFFWRVSHDTISTFADLERHLRAIFTGEVVSKLLYNSNFRYRDIDGILYAEGADRGTNIFAGDEVHEIIRISDHEIIYRVSVDIFDGAWWVDGSNFVDVEIHDFHLMFTDGNWLFSNFHMVR